MDKDKAEERLLEARKRITPLLLRLEAEMAELGIGGLFMAQGDLVREGPEGAKDGDIWAPALERVLNGGMFESPALFHGDAYEKAEADGKVLPSLAFQAVQYVLRDHQAMEHVISLKAYSILNNPGTILYAMTKNWTPLTKMSEGMRSKFNEIEAEINSAIEWLLEHKQPLPGVWAKFHDDAAKDQPKEGDTQANAFSFAEVKDEDGNVIGFRGPDGEVLAFGDHEQGDEHGNG